MWKGDILFVKVFKKIYGNDFLNINLNFVFKYCFRFVKIFKK